MTIFQNWNHEYEKYPEQSVHMLSSNISISQTFFSKAREKEMHKKRNEQLKTWLIHHWLKNSYTDSHRGDIKAMQVN